jgi:hypothetical protein
MATVMYICGVVGNFGGGLLDQFLPQNWIPMFHHHASMMFIQIGIGLCFTALLRGLPHPDPASEPENAGPGRERNQALQQGRLSGGAR